MMNKILVIILFVGFSLSVYSQTQRGFVVESSITAGKQSPLQNVMLRMHGNVNAVLTNENGAFTLKGKALGDKYGFTLVSVYKKGYELADQSVIGRRFAYSKKTPLNIVMLSSKVLNEKKMEIENCIYRNVQQHYSSSIRALNDSLNQEKLKMDYYLSRTVELQKQFDLYEPLITALADHYVRQDYSKMSANDVEVCRMVMDGHIAKADSLITVLENQLQQQKKAHKREKEEIVNDLYNKYAIALARFDLEKAKEYIYLRAEVDSSNIDCLIEAGAFANDYASDFSKSADFYNRALHIAMEVYGEKSEMYALCLNHKGGLLLMQSKFEESLECRKQALLIRQELFGDTHTSVAVCYNNLANIYYSMDSMKDAKDCAQKSVDIYNVSEDYIASDYSASLSTLGGILLALGEWDNAMALFEKALKICDDAYGEMNIHSAVPINDMAVLKDYQGKYTDAIPLYHRAKDIYEKVYGAKHPYVATIYSNLGDSYKEIHNYDSAYIYQSKALEMRIELLGEFHEDVAVSLNNLGSLFSAMKQYDIAIDYYEKCLAIWNAILGKHNERFATTLGNVGILYYRQKNYSQALSYFEEALEFYVKLPDQYTQSLKSIAKLGAMCYYYLKQDENVDHNKLQQDLELFKKRYKSYIDEVK